jgi:hypothetical protein
MCDYQNETLSYYFENGNRVTFSKYYIDTEGIIRNKTSGIALSYWLSGEYNMCTVYTDDNKKRGLRVARAVASTFVGEPPTNAHTADHIISEQKLNDRLDNIRWICKPGQNANRNMPDTMRSSFIIVNGTHERTVKEWVDHLNEYRTHTDPIYTNSMVNHYARRRQRGFSYKEYPDLEDEIWMLVADSETKRGDRWEISNMNRVKQVTKHANNVMWGDRLRCTPDGYPVVSICRKNWLCHILAFAVFFPEEYAAMKSGEMILHEDDDKKDFRPYKLRIGTRSDNGKDAFVNGKHDGTKTAKMKCISYINNELEKEHESQIDAAKYLIFKGCSDGKPRDIAGNISIALKASRNGKIMNAYGRVWKNV